MGNTAVTLSIGGRHVRVGKLLAEGGFAFIYEAETDDTTPGGPGPPGGDSAGKRYILKRMRVPKNHEDLVKIAQKEQEICRSLAPHPNVVEIYGTHIMDIGQDWDYYILMEACQGNVAELVLGHYNRTTYLQQDLVLRVLRDVALALEHLHEREPPLAHRDIKVENVLLGPGGVFKVCDFGSGTTTHYTVTDTSKIPLIAEEISRNTTLAYRAPEQVDLYRQQPVSEKVDIWALGCMIYKLCYFRTPFEDNQGNVEKIGILNGIEALRLPPPFLERLGFGDAPFTPSVTDIMKLCMDQDPTKRPTAVLLLDMADQWSGSGKLPGWEKTQRFARGRSQFGSSGGGRGMGAPSAGNGAGNVGSPESDSPSPGPSSAGGHSWQRSMSDVDKWEARFTDLGAVEGAGGAGREPRAGSPILSPSSGALFRGDSRRASTFDKPDRFNASSLPRNRSVEGISDMGLQQRSRSDVHAQNAAALTQARRSRIDSASSASGGGARPWGEERRMSLVSESVQTGVLGLLGGDKERQRWTIKATSIKPGPPKPKYIRRIVIAIWEEELPLPVLFTFIGLRPLQKKDVVAVKTLLLLLKVMHGGPQFVLTEMASLVPNIEALCKHWAKVTRGIEPQNATTRKLDDGGAADLATVDLSRKQTPHANGGGMNGGLGGDTRFRAQRGAASPGSPAAVVQVAEARRLEAQLGVGDAMLRGFQSSLNVKINENGEPMHVLIAKVASFLVRKLNFHDQNPELSSHYTDTTPGTVRAVPVLAPVHARTVLTLMMDLQASVIDCLKVAERATASREEAVSSTCSAMLLPLVEESFTLLTGQHNLLAVELLLGRTDARLDALLARFRAQYPELRTLFARIQQHPQVRIFGRAPLLVERPIIDVPEELACYGGPPAPTGGSPYRSTATGRKHVRRNNSSGASSPTPPQAGAIGSICLPLAPQARDIFLARGVTLSFRPKAGGAASESPRLQSPGSRLELTKKLVSSGLLEIEGQIEQLAKEAAEEGYGDDNGGLDEDEETSPRATPAGGAATTDPFANFGDAFGDDGFDQLSAFPTLGNRPPSLGIGFAEEDTIVDDDTSDTPSRPSGGIDEAFRASVGSVEEPTPDSFTSHDTFFGGHRRPSARPLVPSRAPSLNGLRQPSITVGGGGDAGPAALASPTSKPFDLPAENGFDLLTPQPHPRPNGGEAVNGAAAAVAAFDPFADHNLLNGSSASQASPATSTMTTPPPVSSRESQGGLWRPTPETTKPPVAFADPSADWTALPAGAFGSAPKEASMASAPGVPSDARP
eukprot:CAMPEP_0118869440 /NCGR_PEP_ID=MMETSP1163-20130328/12771_1 /TAXON_ID=124430 /ORGANISM="Phaeomonas parva, Strain CCMP2877" /LENGTH=1284 /DNA_ID=CAMNT_0006804333 /DNA_START=51 /DNA_END=3901 /DNA_ORIENTATION=-